MSVLKNVAARIYFAGIVFVAAFKLLFKLLFCSLVLCLFVSVGRAQQAPEFPPPQFPDIVITILEPQPPVEYHPAPIEFAQVVLRFDHEDARRTIVEVKARVALALVPVADEHPAPLSKDSILLCRPYNEDNHLMLRCGMDHYAVATITFGEVKQ